MEPNTLQTGDINQKLDAIYASVEKTRKYFLWTMVATVVAFVLPLVGLLFAVPSFLGSYTSQIETLSQ
ncbi:MAG: hypothetical protein JWN64_564 [Parcubacteria group bacterium]|nr:hypothetical protein [Parcubacteria group bacterium]